MSEATEAKAMSDNALEEAQQERERAYRANENARKEREAAQEEAKNRCEAENKANTAKRVVEDTKNTFKSLFIGNSIFTAALAIFMIYDRKSVLSECGKWFCDRGNDIAAFFRWWGWLYMSIAKGMESLKWPVAICFILSVLVVLIIIAVLILILRWLIPHVWDKLLNIQTEYMNGLFKGAISLDIAFILFFCCLWFYAPIKSVFHLNIFSLWLIFSAIGVAIWNAPEIVGGLRY